MEGTGDSSAFSSHANSSASDRPIGMPPFGILFWFRQWRKFSWLRRYSVHWCLNYITLVAACQARITMRTNMTFCDEKAMRVSTSKACGLRKQRLFLARRKIIFPRIHPRLPQKRWFLEFFLFKSRLWVFDGLFMSAILTANQRRRQSLVRHISRHALLLTGMCCLLA